MKLFGGQWSIVDFFIVVGALAAVLTIPGMPKFLHLDSGNPPEHGSPSQPVVSDPKPDPPEESPTNGSRGTKPQPPKKEGQSNGASTVPGGPEIESVGAISAKAWQTIVIKGAHFGAAQPYNGCSDFLRVTDLTDNRVFGLPAPNRFCSPSILVTRWTDTEIVIEGFPNFKQGEDVFKVGDVIEIQVANPSQQGWVTTGDNFIGAPVSTYSVRVETERNDPPAPPPAVSGDTNNPPPRSANATPDSPEIDSVGPISAKAWQTIVIKGTHFGAAQPYNGCSDFLRVTDLTSNQVFGLPAPNRFCSPSLLVTRWTDTEIVIEGFPNFKQGEDVFKVGDVIKIQVANPSQQGWVTTGDNFIGAPAAWYAVRVQSER